MFLRGPGDIVVVSCYELGRQPFAVASALAGLHHAGFFPAVQDVSVDKLDVAALRRAKLVAISVPMHTALRLGTRVAAQAASTAHVCFFGLYAELNAAHLRERHGDSVLLDEARLVELAQSLERGSAGESSTALPLRAQPLPFRSALPVLEKYAQLETPAGNRLVASVEASRGCKHLCRHCPIVPVWKGRFIALDRDLILADIAQQLEQGATHVSFGDPDFLNGPTHALRLARELHQRWPAVTFDATVKIEHLLQHRALLPELAASGCLFITSAVESLNDTVLRALDKGHDALDVEVAVRLTREAGLDLRPTFLPYTPWTEFKDLAALLDFIAAQELEVEPVQLSLRLLIPPGSRILEVAGPWLGALDPAEFGYRWTHMDPRVDEQQRAVAQAVHAGATLDDLRALLGSKRAPARPRHKITRLTEPWFC